MKTLSFFCGLLTAFFAVWVEPVKAESAKTMAAAPRTVSFQIATECSCASCVFDAQRSLKKFDGVQRVKFNGRDHRLEIEFAEGARSISGLAFAVERLDLGKGGALLWPVPKGREAASLSQDLARIPGVKSAKLDAKRNAILLLFQDSPAVTLSQLDAALANQEAAHDKK